MKSVAAFALVCSLLFSPVGTFAKEDAKKKEDAKPINKVCPVEKGEVDPAVTVEHDGKTIGFCCAGCDTAFKKEPAKYMAIVDKELADAKAKDKKGDKKKEAELNKKCPVTDDEADKSLVEEYKGRKIAFCCEGCVDDFKKDPKKYVAKLEKEEAAKKKGDAKKDDEKKDEKPAK